MQRCFKGTRFLDGAGPSPRNTSLIDHLSMPMAHAMQKRGLQVDLSHFARMEKVLEEDLERIETDIQAIAGRYINVASGDQVAKFLFKDLGLKQARPKMTRTGDRESTENDVLVAIQHEHEAVAMILEFKKLDKLRGTYVVPIPKLAKKTAFGQWRVFPRLKHTRVPSGRYAAESPNLLAMPNRTERGREVCEGFITDPGWVYLSVDFSQLEPRVTAHRSQDKRLMSIYFNKEDLYSDFAIPAFSLQDDRYEDAGGWHYPHVDKKLNRFPSKTCVLASFYRVTAKGLLEQMPTICKHCRVEAAKHRKEDCPHFEALWNEDNCQDLINKFYARYERVTAMQKIDDARAKRYGMVWDDFGRMLHTTAVRSVHSWVVSAALREGGNLPIQGSATACLKLAMAELQDVMEQEGLYGEAWFPLLPIHDEVLSEVREDLAEDIGEMTKRIFQNVVKLRVPLDAGWATSESWGKLCK